MRIFLPACALPRPGFSSAVGNGSGSIGRGSDCGNTGAEGTYRFKKARTSRAFDIATKELATHSQSGNQFFGIHASNDGKVMIFAGGIPLKRGGNVVGAVGVSGGSGDQDHAVAEAAASAFA